MKKEKRPPSRERLTKTLPPPQQRVKKPHIILLDLETGPNTAYVWGMYEQNVLGYVHEWDLLCWTVKILGGKSITRSLWDVPSEKDLVRELWTHFDNADVIIAHNGDEFDVKRSNTKFLQYRLKPPSPYKTVDTLKIARSKFAFNSNKLDDLARFLGIKRKIKTGGFELWLKCLQGDKKAQAKMHKYNRRDVVVLEEVYMLMRGWANTHPNLNTFSNGLICPRCQSLNIVKRGIDYTRTCSYQQYQCKACGRWSRQAIKQGRQENVLI